MAGREEVGDEGLVAVSVAISEYPVSLQEQGAAHTVPPLVATLRGCSSWHLRVCSCGILELGWLGWCHAEDRVCRSTNAANVQIGMPDYSEFADLSSRMMMYFDFCLRTECRCTRGNPYAASGLLGSRAGQAHSFSPFTFSQQCLDAY